MQRAQPALTPSPEASGQHPSPLWAVPSLFHSGAHPPFTTTILLANEFYLTQHTSQFGFLVNSMFIKFSFIDLILPSFLLMQWFLSEGHNAVLAKAGSDDNSPQLFLFSFLIKFIPF